MSRPPKEVLRENLEAHRALVAWRTFQSRREPAERIEVLRQHGVTAVYRLVGAGAESGSVIAKRMPQAKARPERTMYECVLPHLPVTAPRFYGAFDDDHGPAADTWLFLEDVGSERYSDDRPDHLALAARWVAGLHGSASEIPAARDLPDGGPGRYHRHLVSAADTLTRRLSGPDLAGADVTLIRGIVELLHGLAARWSEVEQLCAGLPPTVVHGDFRPKNVYLRPSGDRLACYPIDWETAGWGVPAADLTRIDTAVYWSVARDWREGLSLAAVLRLAHIGEMFRTIAAIDWECAGMHFETRHMITRPLASLAVLTPRLSDAARLTGVPA